MRKAILVYQIRKNYSFQQYYLLLFLQFGGVYPSWKSDLQARFTEQLITFMSHNPDELKMLTAKYKSMNIEELKASIDQWDKDIDYSDKFSFLEIAKNELEMKYIERQVQIELLTKSLTSSSRLGRWISSIRAIFKKFIQEWN